MTGKLSLVVPVLLALSAVPASACTILPPPPPPDPQYAGESNEDYAKRVEAYLLNQKYEAEMAAARITAYDSGYRDALWDSASVVAMVEVVEKLDDVRNPGAALGTPGVSLKVVGVARGEPDTAPFALTYKTMTTCGPRGHESMVEGDVGDLFVVFSNTPLLTKDAIFAGYPAKEVGRSSQFRNVETD